MIHLTTILSSNKTYLNKIKKIYESSFPSDERRDFKLVVKLLSDDRFELKGIFVDKDLVGFITTWDFNDFMYVEHFAVAEELRGNGLGSYVLQNIINNSELRIVLEVDLPSDSISFKRIKFYQNFGFVLSHEEYIQPPYDADKSAVPMFVMSKPEIDNFNDFQYIVSTLHTHVYDSPDFKE